MADPVFRFVCAPSALSDAPGAWARDMLREGEVALLPQPDGLVAVDAVARALELFSIAVIRGEATPAAQEETVMAFAGTLPLVWVAADVGAAARAWARDRGPMTLLVAADGGLPVPERRRIDRFLATLGRQSE